MSNKERAKRRKGKTARKQERRMRKGSYDGDLVIKKPEEGQ